MTTGTSLDDGPARRRWAAELLGVGEDAPRAEVRRAYLEKLREGDFQPSRLWRDALRVLEGEAVPARFDQDRLLEDEARLRAEVESFAEEFFALPTSERRRRWDELLAGCRGVPPLAARLRALRAGLAVETAGLPSGESFCGRIAGQLLHSFPLPPLAQATSRQAFLRRIEEPSAEAERPSWEKVARYLLAEWPAFASLDKEFVRHVAELRGRLARRAKLHNRSQKPAEAAPTGEEKNIPWWIGAVLCMLLGAFVRGVTKSDQAASRPSRGSMKPVRPDFPAGPPIYELCDPSKFDIEVIDPKGSRLWRFTPRPGSKITGPHGPRPNDGPPLMYGEAALRLLGISKAKLELWVSQSEKAKRRKGTPKAPPAEKTRP